MERRLAKASRSARSLALTAALVLPMGCAKSRRNDHPYVPYTIDSTPNASDARDAGAPVALEDAASPVLPFVERAAAVAPANAAQWSLEGLLLAAPAGKVFVLGLVGDFDGDRERDAFAIVRDGSKKESLGELVYFRGRSGGVGPAESVAQPIDIANDPAALRSDAGACAVNHRLGQVGKRTVYVEIGVGCPKAGARRAGLPSSARGPRA